MCYTTMCYTTMCYTTMCYTTMCYTTMCFAHGGALLNAHMCIEMYNHIAGYHCLADRLEKI